MTKQQQSPDALNLPQDLVAFLADGKQFEYDPKACEAGAVTLLSLSDLKLQRFPVETFVVAAS